MANERELKDALARIQNRFSPQDWEFILEDFVEQVADKARSEDLGDVFKTGFVLWRLLREIAEERGESYGPMNFFDCLLIAKDEILKRS